MSPGSSSEDRGDEPRRDDTRGAAFVEYLIVLCTVSIIAIFALVALGPELLAHFRYGQMITALPVP